MPQYSALDAGDNPKFPKRLIGKLIQRPQFQKPTLRRPQSYRSLLKQVGIGFGTLVALLGPIVVTSISADTWYWASSSDEYALVNGQWVETGCSSSGTDVFTIDETFGSFTYSQARALDFSWNIVVGHGLQLLMGWILYKVARMALLWTTEQVPVSYSVFASISFSAGNLISLVPILRGTWNTPGWRAKTIMAWIFYATLWVVMVPAVLDATTGYVTLQETMVALDNGILFPWSNCTENANSTMVVCSNQTFAYTDLYNDNDQPLFPPFACLPTQTYSWGFSTRWERAFAILNGVWVLGVYLLWLATKRSSVLQNHGRKPGRWRAIVDLSNSITSDLGSDLNGRSNKEIEEALEEKGPIKYQVSDNRVELSSSSSEPLQAAQVTALDDRGSDVVSLQPRSKKSRSTLGNESPYDLEDGDLISLQPTMRQPSDSPRNRGSSQRASRLNADTAYSSGDFVDHDRID